MCSDINFSNGSTIQTTQIILTFTNRSKIHYDNHSNEALKGKGSGEDQYTWASNATGFWAGIA